MVVDRAATAEYLLAQSVTAQDKNLHSPGSRPSNPLPDEHSGGMPQSPYHWSHLTVGLCQAMRVLPYHASFLIRIMPPLGWGQNTSSELEAVYSLNKIATRTSQQVRGDSARPVWNHPERRWLARSAYRHSHGQHIQPRVHPLLY